MTRKQQQLAKRLAALEAGLQVTLDQVAAIRGELEAQNDDPDPLLDVGAVRERYRVGRDALLAAEERGEIQLERVGGWRKILVRHSVMEAWISCSEPRLAETTEADAAWMRRQLVQQGDRTG